MNPENPGPEPEPQANDPWVEHESTPISAETLDGILADVASLKALVPLDLPFDEMITRGQIELAGIRDAVEVAGLDEGYVEFWRAETPEQEEGILATVKVFPNQPVVGSHIDFNISSQGINRKYNDVGKTADIYKRLLQDKPIYTAEYEDLKSGASQREADELAEQLGMNFVSDQTAQKVKGIIEAYIQGLNQEQ